MAYRLAVTQFPHASWLNGGLDADARDYRLRTTQFTPNGPRIAAAVASLSPGDFTTVWASATGSLFEVQRADDGTAAQVLDWTPTGIWHAATEQTLLGGARGTIKLNNYSEVFGDWREMHTPAVMGRSVNGTAHWYGNIAQDGAGNVYYGTTTSVAQTWRLNPSTEVWTQLQSTPSYSQLGSSLEWFPDANSGSGGLIKSLDFATSTLRVILLNAAETSWSTLASGVPNSQHALLRYHPDHNRVLILGGTNTQTAATFLEADGTATASATAIPANIHGMSPACWVAAHSSGCWLVRSGASGRLYAAWPNATYDDITWVDLAAAPDAALTNPTIVQGYATDTLLIVSTTGIHAWRVPNLGPTATASLSAALQVARTASASVAAAIQQGKTATASIAAAIQSPQSAGASLAAAVQASDSATASLAAALQAEATESADLSAAIQKSQAATASLSAYLQAGFTASADLSAALQVSGSRTASLAAAVQVSDSVTSSLSAALQQTQAATASLSAYIEGAASVSASLAAAIQSAQSATASLAAAVSVQLSRSASLAAALAIQNAATSSLAAAVLGRRTRIASIAAFIFNPAAETPANIPPSRRARLAFSVSGGRPAQLSGSRRPRQK
jgi:hypothetical protein